MKNYINMKFMTIDGTVKEGIFIFHGADFNQFGNMEYFLEDMDEVKFEVPFDYIINVVNCNSLENDTLLDKIKNNISVRTYNILKRSGFNSLEQVQRATFETLKNVRNMSRKSLEEISNLLKISFGENEPTKAIDEYLFSFSINDMIEEIEDLNSQLKNKRIELLMNLAKNVGASYGEKINSVTLAKRILGIA